MRIYPVPFRQRAYTEQYKKYDWIELDLVKNTSDFRPESFRPATLKTEINVVGHIDTARNWIERKKLCLGKIYYNLSELIAEAKDKSIGTSLAVFKPSEILDFYAEPVDREWSSKQKAVLAQQNLFETKFEVVRKLPYKFKFRFRDDQGKESNMMIEDWETGQLFWRQLSKYEGNEQKATDDVRKKYFNDFAMTKDLHFYLGTTQKNHYVSHNPFMIIGTFHPKIENQMRLF